MRNAICILYVIVFFLAGWLAYICYRDLRFDADSSAGIIVSVLGVIIALLIGWQILNAVEINKKVDAVLRRSNEIDKQLSDANKMNYSIRVFSTASMYRLDGKFNATHDNIGEAIVQYLNAINAYEKADMLNCSPHMKEVIIEICDLIPKIKNCDCEKITVNINLYKSNKSIFNATIISLLNAIRFRIHHATEPLLNNEEIEIERIKKEASYLAAPHTPN